MLIAYYAFYADQWFEELRVHQIAYFRIGITVLVSFWIIAGDAWITTMMVEENKSKGALWRYIGVIIGETIGYKIRIPLTNYVWLNKNIFHSDFLSQPILTNKYFLLFVSFQFFALVIYWVVYVREAYLQGREGKIVV